MFLYSAVFVYKSQLTPNNDHHLEHILFLNLHTTGLGYILDLLSLAFLLVCCFCQQYILEYLIVIVIFFPLLHISIDLGESSTPVRKTWVQIPTLPCVTLGLFFLFSGPQISSEK